MIAYAKTTLRRAFSLAEIMVVIAIIGIMSSIAVVHFSNARAVARDDIRKSTLKSLQLAIELYKTQNGLYPAAGCPAETGGWRGRGPHDPIISANTNDCPEYIVGLVPDFISELPSDPTREMDMSIGYLYRTTPDRSGYKLTSRGAVEKQFITSYADEFARCPRDMGSPHCGPVVQKVVYAVYSKNGEGL